MPDPRHRMREFSDDELKLIAGLTYDGALQARLSEEALIEVGRRIELDAQDVVPDPGVGNMTCIECSDGAALDKCCECNAVITERTCHAAHYTTCQCMTCGDVYQDCYLICTTCAKEEGSAT